MENRKLRCNFTVAKRHSAHGIHIQTLTAMNAKTIRYQQAVEGYITSITRDILADKGFYPVALEDSEGPYMLSLVLPSPQRCGTETQKYTYARLKAQEIVEDMKKWSPHLDYATFE